MYQKIYDFLNLFFEDCKIEEIVHTSPTLSDEEANNFEGTTRALKSMKNNKTPGTDGFTSEFFYIMFWKHLLYFVVRSLINGFNKSE